MPDLGRFEVDLDHLRVHVDRVRSFARQAEVAAGAAAHVARLDDAYGLIPRTLGWPAELAGTQERIAEMVDACTRLLHDTGHRLNQTIDAYVENELEQRNVLQRTTLKLGGAE